MKNKQALFHVRTGEVSVSSCYCFFSCVEENKNKGQHSVGVQYCSKQLLPRNFYSVNHFSSSNWHYSSISHMNNTPKVIPQASLSLRNIWLKLCLKTKHLPLHCLRWLSKLVTLSLQRMCVSIANNKNIATELPYSKAHYQMLKIEGKESSCSVALFSLLEETKSRSRIVWWRYS